jgi:pyruvate/2-oxoglutarate dehydrogenase complex dihydrolipoamide dehydrogenase (E3) component
VSEGKAYDLVVIGSGTAAQVASFRVRAAGWSVAVIDHLPFGGTCALRGCDPKKMLISGAEAINTARRMRGRGVTGELAISWPELIAFKRTFTDPAHIAAGAGAKVTVLQRAERMLPRFEPELVGWLMEKYAEIGVEVQTGTAVEAVEEVDSGFRVRGRAGNEETAVDADLVVHAAGRAPDLDLCRPLELPPTMGASRSMSFCRVSQIQPRMRPVTRPPKGRH